MRRYTFHFALAICVLLLTGSVAFSQQNTTRAFFQYDVDKITVAATSIGFTSAKITPFGQVYWADKISCIVKCASSSPCEIAIRADGQAATTTTGETVNAGERFSVYWHANIVNFRAIRTGSNSAELWCNVYR